MVTQRKKVFEKTSTASSPISHQFAIKIRRFIKRYKKAAQGAKPCAVTFCEGLKTYVKL